MTVYPLPLGYLDEMLNDLEPITIINLLSTFSMVTADDTNNPGLISDLIKDITNTESDEVKDINNNTWFDSANTSNNKKPIEIKDTINTKSDEINITKASIQKHLNELKFFIFSNITKLPSIFLEQDNSYQNAVTITNHESKDLIEGKYKELFLSGFLFNLSDLTLLFHLEPEALGPKCQPRLIKEPHPLMPKPSQISLILSQMKGLQRLKIENNVAFVDRAPFLAEFFSSTDLHQDNHNNDTIITPDNNNGHKLTFLELPSLNNINNMPQNQSKHSILLQEAQNPPKPSIFKHLTHLDLSMSNFTGPDLDLLLTTTSFPSLTSLNLSSNKLQLQHPQVFAKALKWIGATMPVLKELNLSRNELRQETLVEYLGKDPLISRLEVLDLKGNYNLNGEAITMFFESEHLRNEGGEDQNENDGQKPGKKTGSKIKKLILAETNIHSHNLTSLMKLNNLPYLEEIDLSNTKINDQGIEALCNTNFKLKKLNISLNYLTSYSVKLLALSPNMSNLTHLTISHCKGIKLDSLFYLAKSPYITKLESIEFASLNNLLNNQDCHLYVNEPDESHCEPNHDNNTNILSKTDNITDNILQQFFTSPNLSKLTHLHLHQLNLPITILQYIGESLYLTNLKSIYIGFNQFMEGELRRELGDVGGNNGDDDSHEKKQNQQDLLKKRQNAVKAFVSSPNVSNLTILNLPYCNINDHDIEIMVDPTNNRLDKLEELYLNINAISDRSFVSLFTKSPFFSHLTIFQLVSTRYPITSFYEFAKSPNISSLKDCALSMPLDDDMVKAIKRSPYFTGRIVPM